MTRKKKLLIVIVIAILGIALIAIFGKCQTAFLIQKAEDARCVLTGGQPGYGPLMWCGYEASSCEYRYKDAGKICHSSKECEGGCMGAAALLLASVPLFIVTRTDVA